MPGYAQPIVFCRIEVGPAAAASPSKVWIMEGNGERLEPLTRGLTTDTHPTLTEDRRHVVYCERLAGRERTVREGRLVRLSLATGERETLLAVAGADLHHATVSPVNGQIAFQLSRDGVSSQWIGAGGDSHEIRVPALNAIALPDGAVFQCERDRRASPRRSAIARVAGRGRGATITLLTDGDHLDRRPAVSPDGGWLAWQSNAAGGQAIVLCGAGASGAARPVTHGAGEVPGARDERPWFTRDGRALLFDSDRGGTREIWRLELGSGACEPLTAGRGLFLSYGPRS